ncbi:hypothetical protein [Asticcacaulis sp. YBE204]|uniref:hypothetical protein n=1 Tax=Asticcacaulis sp. YBE204 TaxID=1282363 RepID=UPI0003C3F1E4|nr:hypothetical protein [Asticcacaulis sp. YBE204]ESQ80003.1 hypothetical protein AEYBE204_09140 [Asticcacaulis sp. YBE204]
MKFVAVNLCLALVLSAGNAIVVPVAQAQVSDASADTAVDIAMAYLKENKLFSLLMRTEPGFEAEARAEFRRIATSVPADKVQSEAQAYGTKVVLLLIEKYTIKSSDAAIEGFLQQNLKMAIGLKDRPADCVAYVMGTGKISLEIMTPAIIEAETEIKYQLLESALTRPAAFTPMAISDLLALVEKRYAAIGGDISNLTLLDQATSLPPAQGCQVVTQFSQMLTAGTPTENATLYRNFLYLSKQSQAQ